MQRLPILIASLLLTDCGSGPTKQEQNLSQRESGPEQMTNLETGHMTAGTAPAVEQGQLGDTMPDKSVGPTSDRSSGTGGDSVPSR